MAAVNCGLIQDRPSEPAREECLKPRNGFMGAHTNAIKLYHKTQGNKRIKYYDVTSLYTYTNKYEEYMVGHCEIITNLPQHAKISDYFGSC